MCKLRQSERRRRAKVDDGARGENAAIWRMCTGGCRTPLSAHNTAQRVAPVAAVVCRVRASPAMALAIDTAVVRRMAMIVPELAWGAQIRIREPLRIAHDILRWLR